VEQRHGANRHHLEQQVTSPRNVRRQRGDEVDDPDRKRDRARKRWQASEHELHSSGEALDLSLP
jgi:hypothetical protein